MKWARLESRLILSFNYHGQILAIDIEDVTGERMVQSPRMAGKGWIGCFKLWVWDCLGHYLRAPSSLRHNPTASTFREIWAGKNWGPGHEVCIIKLLRFKDLIQTGASQKMCSIMTVMDLSRVNLQNQTPMDQWHQNMMQHRATSINAGVLSSSSGEAAGA